MSVLSRDLAYELARQLQVTNPTAIPSGERPVATVARYLASPLASAVATGAYLTVGADGTLTVTVDGTATTLSIGGTVVTGGLTASGSTSNDFSGSTGTMKTSSGLFTVTGPAAITTDTRSGAGAVSVTTSTTKVTTTGAAQALTLADGADGQIKTVIHDVDGGSAVLTPTTKTGFTTITFTAVGETATLQFVTTRGWMILALNGAVAA